jgi:hypothetical protein
VGHIQRGGTVGHIKRGGTVGHIQRGGKGGDERLGVACGLVFFVPSAYSASCGTQLLRGQHRDGSIDMSCLSLPHTSPLISSSPSPKHSQNFDKK